MERDVLKMPVEAKLILLYDSLTGGMTQAMAINPETDIDHYLMSICACNFIASGHEQVLNRGVAEQAIKEGPKSVRLLEKTRSAIAEAKKLYDYYCNQIEAQNKEGEE